MPEKTIHPDTLVRRSDIMQRLGVTSETIRRWLRDKKLPAPDVDLSRKTRAWKVSTLQAAGFNLW